MHSQTQERMHRHLQGRCPILYYSITGWVSSELRELNVEDSPDVSTGCRSRLITVSFLIIFAVALSCRSAVEVTLKNWFPKSLLSYCDGLTVACKGELL